MPPAGIVEYKPTHGKHLRLGVGYTVQFSKLHVIRVRVRTVRARGRHTSQLVTSVSGMCESGRARPAKLHHDLPRACKHGKLDLEQLGRGRAASTGIEYHY